MGPLAGLLVTAVIFGVCGNSAGGDHWTASGTTGLLLGLVVGPLVGPLGGPLVGPLAETAGGTAGDCGYSWCLR